jgi:hypothetical protein
MRGSDKLKVFLQTCSDVECKQCIHFKRAKYSIKQKFKCQRKTKPHILRGD